MKLFKRRWALVIGGLRIEELRCQFTAVKSLKAEPNTLRIAISNMNPSNRAALEKAKALSTYLEAGYEDGIGQIFLGDVRSTTTSINGPEIDMEFNSGDGSKAIRGQRVNVTFGQQVTVPIVLDYLAKSLGVKPGNLSQAKAALASKGLATLFPSGLTLYGNAWRRTQDFARSAGLEISIQDGALLILDVGKSLTGRAVLLTPDTGLIEHPSIDADGIVQFNCLMIPDIRPGVRVQIDSEGVKGFYRVYHCEYKGDTSPESTQWGISCHATPEKTVNDVFLGDLGF